MEKFSLSLSLLDCTHILPPLPCPMSCSVLLSSMLWKCGQNQQLLSFMRSDIHLTNFHIICRTIHTFLMCRSVHSATANSLATPCSLHCLKSYRLEHQKGRISWLISCMVHMVMNTLLMGWVELLATPSFLLTQTEQVKFIWMQRKSGHSDGQVTHTHFRLWNVSA